MSKRATALDSDSGDPTYSWRHPVPNNWRKVRLGGVIEIIRGISFPKDAKTHEPRKGYVACLRTTNVQRDVEWEDLWFVPEEHVKRGDQYVRQGDILISTANSYELVGKVAPVTSMPYPATLGAFISLLRPRDDIDSKFAYYQIAWGDTQERIRSTASTTTNISNVSTRKLANIELAIPPFDQQKRIVGEIEKQFSRLDEAVADLKRVKANLKRYKAAVLKAAVEGRLVETEASIARREGRSYETGEQLLQRILETRRSRALKAGTQAGRKGKGKYKAPAGPDTTDLPELPEGWVWVTLRDVVEIIDYRGRTPPFSESGIPHLRSSNVRDGKVVWTSLAFVTDETFDAYMTRGLPQERDVLFTTEAPLGELAMAPKVKFSLAQRMMLLRPSHECFDSRFFMFELMSPLFQARLGKSGTGTTVTGVSSRNFQPLPLAVPPLAEQRRIVAEVDRRLSVIEELETTVAANLQRATHLRQSVLQRAFSGS